MCGTDWTIDVRIEHPWLRSAYTALVSRSRLLTGIAIVVSLLSNVLTELMAVAAGADVLALLFLFISITRVATDKGSITRATATPLQAEETVEYSDETADERE